MKHNWMFLIFLIALSACVGNTADNYDSYSKAVSNENKYNPKTIGISEEDSNIAYENEYQNTKKFFLGASNTLFDIKVELLSAGHINISENSETSEYFRIDFSVTNHRVDEEKFDYGAFISDNNYTNPKRATADEKSYNFGYLKPNQTKRGYLLFRNFRTPATIIELLLSGGYKVGSYSPINFRFRIAFQREGYSGELMPLDFRERNALSPGSFLLTVIPEAGTYGYTFDSDERVSIEIWPPGTKSNTIMLNDSSSNCSTISQKNGTKNCFINSSSLLTIKLLENLTQNTRGAIVTFKLFKLTPIQNVQYQTAEIYQLYDRSDIA